MNSGDQMYINQPPKEGRGAMIGSIIVILILIAGAIYYFSATASNTVAPAPVTPVVEQAPTPVPQEPSDTTTSQLQQQGSSDNIADIEADATATNLSGLDQDL